MEDSFEAEASHGNGRDGGMLCFAFVLTVGFPFEGSLGFSVRVGGSWFGPEKCAECW